MLSTCEKQEVVYPNNNLGGFFMQFENRIICHPAYLQDIPKSDIIRQGCVSICDNHRIEQMIFLIPCISDVSGFEVRIYKAQPTDTYVPNTCDFNLIKHTENDEFASFFFVELFYAWHFIRVLEHNHPEYKVRPKFQA